ncbi:hypothetical protein [Campylobacter magnus]|uniref:hypothetical protein n=1 Tax=Campylobacter magnus TaxID=3026462 RepID=UPI0023615EA3|nr:hypothetical protein [Campylobacter magnus]MDD0855938.1 hypothetical protein [Campylobacter magnus]
MFLSQNESPENASPVIGIIFIIAIWISCHLGKYSKFYILKTFVNTLKESNGDDALLASKGGINKIGLVLGILATPLVIIQAIFLISIIYTRNYLWCIGTKDRIMSHIIIWIIALILLVPTY